MASHSLEDLKNSPAVSPASIISYATLEGELGQKMLFGDKINRGITMFCLPGEIPIMESSEQ